MACVWLWYRSDEAKVQIRLVYGFPTDQKLFFSPPPLFVVVVVITLFLIINSFSKLILHSATATNEPTNQPNKKFLSYLPTLLVFTSWNSKPTLFFFFSFLILARQMFCPDINLMTFVSPSPFHYAWKGEEDKADRGRGGKTTSGNGQAWSSPSPWGQWRTGKNGGNRLRNHLWCPNDPRG